MSRINMVVNGVSRFIFNSDYRFRWFAGLGLYKKMNDEEYLKRLYKANFGKPLNLEAPETFNEKMQWLKLYNRDPRYIQMVDKYLVKDYVGKIIGFEHIIPTIGVWDRAEDLNFDDLPNQFVLKCNHNSGKGMYICRDKSKCDMHTVIRNLRLGLAQDYYSINREWPYKDVQRKIIAEKYMEDSDGSGELTDYKIHCYNGIPKIVQVITNRFSTTGMVNDHYTLEWDKLDLVRGHYHTKAEPVKKPDELDEMLQYSRMLCQDIPYVRTDFYIIRHKVYFGEITFFPASGFNSFHPDKWDKIFGEWIQLPEKKIT